jgi:hypothetical protein
MTKQYIARGGFRTPVGRVEVDTNGDGDGPPLRQHTRHSPDGHSWGYHGSGPAQLALDILWDFLGHEPSPTLYQRFKDEVIAKFPQDSGFVLTDVEIQDWLTKLEVPR